MAPPFREIAIVSRVGQANFVGRPHSINTKETRPEGRLASTTACPTELRVSNLLRLRIPIYFLIVLERQSSHMAGDRGLLTRHGRRDHFLITAHRFDEIADVIDYAIGLA